MVKKVPGGRAWVAVAALALAVVFVSLMLARPWLGAGARDLVSGDLIQFSDNGAWCWYQDERAVVDAAGGKLIVGSVANGHGAGGLPRDGQIDATVFDLSERRGKTFALNGDVPYSGDDHNAPAFLVLPDGRYLAMYTGHNMDNVSRYLFYDGGSWGADGQFDWGAVPGGSDYKTTYSNLFYLPAEGRVYNIARGEGRSPNIMVSDDLGRTWSYGGRLTATDTVGYVNGYFKYSSNGFDRIDFIATEHHPRDFSTGIYHGYVKGGKSYRTDGTLLDGNVSDRDAPRPQDFTPVFLANTTVGGHAMTRCWDIDLQDYEDGTIGALFECRADDSEYDHRFFYARYDGSGWKATYLGKAGPKLYKSEQDYTGLGALHPEDPSVIYVSTPADPRDDADLGVHEIFRGETADGGATWAWTPVTQNSTRDNMRPIVPAWKDGGAMLLWWRGTYDSMVSFDAAVVGLFEDGSETRGRKTYVDATAANTMRSDGLPLDAEGGVADGRWHVEQRAGNGGSVLAAAGNGDAPPIRTRVAVPGEGTYDVWVNFWADPGEDWRVRAGLPGDETTLFRQVACEQVEEGEHDGALAIRGSGGMSLYQAYLGRVRAGGGGYLDVSVDDDPSPGTGCPSLADLVAGGSRTWYDGISYARVGAGDAAA